MSPGARQGAAHADAGVRGGRGAGTPRLLRGRSAPRSPCSPGPPARRSRASCCAACSTRAWPPPWSRRSTAPRPPGAPTGSPRNIAAELAGFDEHDPRPARRRHPPPRPAPRRRDGRGRRAAARARRRAPRARPPPATCSRACATPRDRETPRMIIDCHGHYTTAPAAHTAWREAQRAAFDAGRAAAALPDDLRRRDPRDASRRSQLRLMAERGIDLTVFSPRASAMGHHLGDEAVSSALDARSATTSIARVVGLFPDRFVGVCQLPQSPGVPIAHVRGRAAPLRRGAGVRRLQPQPRPQRRALDRRRR